MKRITSFIMLFLSLYGYGQENYRKAFLNNRHELRLGLGIQPVLPQVHIGSDINPTGQEAANYLAKEIKAPSANITYSYRLRQWLSLGTMASFGSIYRKYNESFDNKYVRTYSHEFFSLIPLVRFHWYNGPSVSFYSTVGLGIGITSIQNYDGYKGVDENILHPAYTLNFLGINIGRKFFGYSELGYSSSGIIQFGIGYKF